VTAQRCAAPADAWLAGTDPRCRRDAAERSTHCAAHAPPPPYPRHVPVNGEICNDPSCDPCADIRHPPGTWPCMPTEKLVTK
jgi:hypothetical protein